ncbi:S26 family signal peptidase [Bacteroidota bacterium]
MLAKINNILSNKYVRFGIAGTIYILWVIWLGNYWWMFGLGVVFDIYVTKKVNWSFWKSRKKKNSVFIEWLDALIFAVIAVTVINIFLFQNYKIPTPSMEKSLLVGDHLYVSKVSYGPRVPNTPLSFPFTSNTMPLIGGKSYVEWIKRPYKRLAGFGKVKNNDAVVFNFPAGDTVVVRYPERSYYSIVRDYAMQIRQNDIRNGQPELTWEQYLDRGRRQIWDEFEIVYRPVDRRDNYIKRCIAIPGDTLLIRDGRIFINSVPVEVFEGVQHKYYVQTNGTPINPKAFERLGVARADQEQMGSTYIIPLSNEKVERLRGFTNVVSIRKYSTPVNEYNHQIFPHDSAYKWTLDNFGPLWMPYAGATIELSLENLPLYKRIIEGYEGKSVVVRDGQIYIDGSVVNEYTFELGYYYMIGDNRHSSSDCRYWGYVPEDHILGKPKFIWLSLDKDKRFLGKIRWNRMFMGTDKI